MKNIYTVLLATLIIIFIQIDAQGQPGRKRGKNRKTSITVPAKYKVDNDGDKVPDVRDQCPNTPKGMIVDKFGCPLDSDKDGLYDHEDSCPKQPGPKVNKGCPYGDIDGDGITDDQDKCPKVPGVAKYDGCPAPNNDKDGDGVIDSKDKCPNVPGVPSNHGCPVLDTDGDGVLDKDDKCITVPGTVKNHGCPELINKEEAAILEKASKVEFAFGRSEIKKEWYSVLDEVALILKKYPKASLEMAGHTDSIGDDAKNLQLSKDRSAAVREYLISKGIGSGRIESKGFGETRPIADNNTNEGRQRNRRVNMHIFDKSQK